MVDEEIIVVVVDTHDAIKASNQGFNFGFNSKVLRADKASAFFCVSVAKHTNQANLVGI